MASDFRPGQKRNVVVLDLFFRKTFQSYDFFLLLGMRNNPFIQGKKAFTALLQKEEDI